MLFSREIPKHQRMIEDDLEHILALLPITQPDTPEYAKLLTSAERLFAMLDHKRSAPISRDTLLTVGANLLGILLIIKHEDVNPITSKALGFVIRTR
jgi:hypothetical protein